MAMIVFAEGESDAAALRVLAAKLAPQSRHNSINIESLGGASGYRLAIPDTHSQGRRFCGLYDLPELDDVAAGFARIGIDVDGAASLEDRGFFACRDNLEDELISALGIDGVEEVIRTAGEAGPLETLRSQPAWRDQPRSDVLRRFFSSQSGRKQRYAALMTDALDLDAVPRPLRAVLDHALRT